jgi:serine/threonine protein kinase
MATTQTVQTGDILVGNFRIEGLLGEGGMGIVYKATNLGTGSACAVKVILPHLAARPGVLGRFEVEAKVGSKIGKSQYIVDVIFAGVDSERQVPFLVMELLTGDSLAKHIERGQLEPALARTLVDQLSEALDQAHRAGVVHRDLKPSNLHVTFDWKGRPVLKVLDFGIAKLLEGDAHATATEIGTPVYAAPEQLGPLFRKTAAKRGVTVAETVSPQTDIWSLGLIIFEMTTGLRAEQYWDAGTAGDLALAMAEALRERPAATQRAGDRASLLPLGFDGWFARCMEMDSAKRWPSAGEAAAAFFAMYKEQRRSSQAPTPMPVQAPVAATPIAQTSLAGLGEFDPSRQTKPGPAAEAHMKKATGAPAIGGRPATRLPGVEDFAASRVPQGKEAPKGRPRGSVGVVIAVLWVVGLLAVGGVLMRRRADAPAPSANANPSASVTGIAAATVSGAATTASSVVTAAVAIPAPPASATSTASASATTSLSATASSAPFAATPSSRRVPAPTSLSPPTVAPTGPDTIDAVGHVWLLPPAPTKLSWADAKAYCARQPGGPWRLPSADELVALSTSGAAADSRFFWSSTLAPSAGEARSVDFANGRQRSDSMSYPNNYARCVR